MGVVLYQLMNQLELILKTCKVLVLNQILPILRFLFIRQLME